MERYEHRQAATTLWLTLTITTVLIAVIAWAVTGRVPAEERSVVVSILAAIVALMVLAGWLFSSLTVRIDAVRIELSFGPGWPRKSLALSHVRTARPVRNRWWYGWGIRLTPHGWLWNVAGLDAVELELTDGSTTRIGTDEPQSLAAAIEQAIGH